MSQIENQEKTEQRNYCDKNIKACSNRPERSRPKMIGIGNWRHSDRTAIQDKSRTNGHNGHQYALQ